MRFLTDFADLAVLLPLAVCIGVGLLLAGWRQGAMAWAAAMGATLAAMMALKLVCLGCGSVNALSPSGHTAAGTAIYGGVLALWLRRWLGPTASAVIAGGAVATVIGATRLALHAHRMIEVVIGAGVGLAGVLLLLYFSGTQPRPLQVRWLIPVGLVLVFLLHGARLQAEPRLRALAGWLPASVCHRLQ